MKRTAFHQLITDKTFLCLASFYGLLVAVWFAAGRADTGTVWALMFTAAIAVFGYLGYRSNLRSLTRQAEWDRDRHESDLRMERLAQEADIMREDHQRRMEAIRTEGVDPGPSDLARSIRERRDAEYDARDAQDRADRQARIAAFEAQSIDAA